MLTADIKVRFPNARATREAYEQQRNQQHNRDKHAYNLLGHTGQVCSTIISPGHSGDTSQDDSLHTTFVANPAFRGKDNSSLSQLLRGNLHKLYDMLFDKNAEVINAPEDFYTAILDATEADGDGHATQLDAMHILYLIEF
jgi:hypothetical protein